MQGTVATLPGFTLTCVEQIKSLNDKVFEELNKIFNEYETTYREDESLIIATE